MTAVTLEHDAGKLVGLTTSVTICDPSGRVLGSFTPRFDPAEYEGTECPVSEEEIERRMREGVWYTTDQVREFLKGLGDS